MATKKLETPDEMQKKWDAEIAEAGALTEQQMRDAEVPWPKTEADLLMYINALLNRPHSYGTCVYAMSMAATAAFYFVCHKLRTTGFQASCADLDFIRRTRSLKGPFIILKAEDLFYPQYDLRERLEEFISENAPWLKKEAEEKLAKAGPDGAHPKVMEHWQKLAS